MKTQKRGAKLNIGILGFGNMGQAIFNLLKKSADSDFSFFIYSLETKKVPCAQCLSNQQELFEKSDIVFLCIKPQDFYKISPLKKKLKTLIISIMAGVNIANIEKVFKTKKIVRSMPNLALQIGKSVTGWYLNDKNFTVSEIKFVEKIICSFGMSLKIKKEFLLDSITAISGSGPAYVFLFLEALEKSAEKLGLDKITAQKAVAGTIEGALAYRKEQKLPLEDLIEKVKSKKGTTEAALKIIKPDKFYLLWQKATQKAFQRAKELSSYEIK